MKKLHIDCRICILCAYKANRNLRFCHFIKLNTGVKIF